MKCYLKKSGFTLIELLVAATISAIMLTVLAAIAQSFLKNYQTTQKDLLTRRDAEFAMDLLIPDLEAMVIPRGTNVESFRASVELVNGIPMAWITLISSAMDRDPDNLSGVARALSYRTAFQDTITPSGTDRSFAIYRAIAGASDTFGSALTSTNLQTEFWNNPARSTTDLGDYVVGNVLEFRVSFLPTGQTNWQSLADPGDFLSITSTDAKAQIAGNIEPLHNGISSLEIMLTVISSQGADLLRSGAITREKALAEHGRSFTRRTSHFNRLP